MVSARIAFPASDTIACAGSSRAASQLELSPHQRLPLVLRKRN